MMKLEEIFYSKAEGGVWHKLTLTPNEVEQVKDYLSSIKPPVASGYIRMPFTMNRFFPMTWLEAIKINDEVWDATNGWRS
ncbi:MAG: hypothetical protein KJO69_05065 [Gammaproteobacteria bacterium]|nr:hypothetical protein [Gammaproteobacteria bacterium]